MTAEIQDSHPTLDAIIRRAHQLYSLPAVAVEVLELTAGATVDARALKLCLEKDPALTSKVLRVVNSSLFGLSGHVADLNQALALLGTKPLKMLVLGFSLPQQLFTNLARRHLERFWRDALTRAVACRQFSERFWGLRGDEPFIAGLLMDIGILALIQQLGRPYLEFLDLVSERREDLATLEFQTLGFDHTQLSARLLQHWSLPKSLVVAVATSRSAPGHGPISTRGVVTQILYLADCVVQLVAQRRIAVLPDLLEAGRTSCGLTRDQLVEFVARLEENVARLGDVLAIELPGDLHYQDLLMEAHVRLSCEAEAYVSGTVDRMPSEVHDTISLSSESMRLAECAAKLARQHGNRRGQATRRATVRRATDAETGPGNASWDDGLSPNSKDSRVDVGVAEDDVRELENRLRHVAADCRARRCELSLLLVEVDHIHNWLAAVGPEAADHLIAPIELACGRIDQPGMDVLRVGQGRLAMVLPDCDRRFAVEFARCLKKSVQDADAAQRGEDERRFTLSVGAATAPVPPKNFNVLELIDHAEQCLYAAQASGGNAVKSIEI
jgi:diguanylate cyclase (GGDEF)-like protein